MRHQGTRQLRNYRIMLAAVIFTQKVVTSGRSIKTKLPASNTRVMRAQGWWLQTSGPLAKHKRAVV